MMLLLTLQHQQQVMHMTSCKMLSPQQRQPANRLLTMLLHQLQMLCMKDSARQITRQMLCATQPQVLLTPLSMQ
jgi:hypothetical protein